MVDSAATQSTGFVPMRTTTSSAAPSALSAAAEGEQVKVQIKDLNFYYDKFHALKTINLSLYDRKVTAFVGPSGCGKSTLLRILNRMYQLYPKQRAVGEILVDGANILAPNQDLNLLRAKIGMVFQKPTPFRMSIYDNIAFGVRLHESAGRRADLRARTPAR